MFHDIEKKNRGPVQLGPLEGCPVSGRHFASSCEHCKRIWAGMVKQHREIVTRETSKEIHAQQR
jgi:hypothetical protein